MVWVKPATWGDHQAEIGLDQGLCRAREVGELGDIQKPNLKLGVGSTLPDIRKPRDGMSCLQIACLGLISNLGVGTVPGLG